MKKVSVFFPLALFMCSLFCFPITADNVDITERFEQYNVTLQKTEQIVNLTPDTVNEIAILNGTDNSLIVSISISEKILQSPVTGIGSFFARIAEIDLAAVGNLQTVYSAAIEFNITAQGSAQLNSDSVIFSYSIASLSPFDDLNQLCFAKYVHADATWECTQDLVLSSSSTVDVTETDLDGIFAIVSRADFVLPLPGGAFTVFSMVGPSTLLNQPVKRYGVIPQNSLIREWDSLSSRLTYSAWVWWSGKGDKFSPIISRHPGENFRNEWAHFHVQITNVDTKLGGNIVAWAGCGCADPPTVGQDRILSKCGIGYWVRSNKDGFYAQPETWFHVTVTMDGDGSSVGGGSEITKYAHMYINGKLVDSNPWAGGTFDRPRQNVCKSRKMLYDLLLPASDTIFEDVSLGYLDNQDINLDPLSTNPNRIHGLTGRIDEVRIYNRPITSEEAYLGYLTWLKGDEPGLVAYYRFNPTSQTVPGPFFSNLAENSGGLPIAFPLEVTENTWEQALPLGLQLNEVAPVVGSLPADESRINNSLNFYAWNPFNSSLSWYVTDFIGIDSLLAAGQAFLYDSNGVEITLDNYHLLIVKPPLTLQVICNDTLCQNANPTSDVASNAIGYSVLNADSGAKAYTYLSIKSTCPSGTFDACGVCDGDNSSCQCVTYHGFHNTRMQYVLLTFSVENIIAKINGMIDLLNTTLHQPIPSASDLPQQIESLMDFYNSCLTPYCGAIYRFAESISQINSTSSTKSVNLPAFASSESMLTYP